MMVAWDDGGVGVGAPSRVKTMFRPTKSNKYQPPLSRFKLNDSHPESTSSSTSVGASGTFSCAAAVEAPSNKAPSRSMSATPLGATEADELGMLVSYRRLSSSDEWQETADNRAWGSALSRGQREPLGGHWLVNALLKQTTVV